MAMVTSACQALVIMVIAAAALSMASGTALQYNFYSSSCPEAEEAVRNATQKIIYNDPTMGAAFVRLFFHDCFVRVMINWSSSCDTYTYFYMKL